MKINKKNKTCRKKEKSDIGAAILFLAPNFIGFMIFTLIPMVFSLVMSLYDWPLTGTHTFVGLKNFITLFTKDILFFKVMKNTFVYVIAYVALNVVIALGMAVWITSLKKANQFFRSVFFLPMMVFVHVNPKERKEVLSFSTVSRYMVMRGESNPAVIPDEQMARFRFMLDYSKEAVCMSSSPLARGEQVRVIKGPLSGLVGELVSVDGKSKIAVRLNMLGCACVDMPAGYVESIKAVV